MDWATRHVLAWHLSNTMDASFCVEALDDALGWRAPEILNTDQGAQARFTSGAFADRVLGAGVNFSMDGRGRFLDNIASPSRGRFPETALRLDQVPLDPLTSTLEPTTQAPL